MKLYEVIQNEVRHANKGSGTRAVLAARFSGENFADNSQLIVSDSEEAVFLRDGNLVSTFSGGRYTLTTNNHPFLSRIRNMFSGGRSAFVASIYFVNLEHKMALKWGTATPLVVRDPVFGLKMDLRARGAYTVHVTNSERFLLKFLGTNQALLTEEELKGDFSSAFLESITDVLVDYIQESDHEVLDVLRRKRVLAEQVKPTLASYLDSYGLGLADFHIEAIDPVDNENLQKVEAATAAGLATRITGAADNDALRMTNTTIQQMGSNWERYNQAEALRDIAKNPGAGGLASAGAGIFAGQAFGQMASQQFVQPSSLSAPGDPEHRGYQGEGHQSALFCSSCGARSATGANFCGKCGTELQLQTACRNCAEEIAPDAKFCGRCGTAAT